MQRECRFYSQAALAIIFLVIAVIAYWPTLHAMPVGDDWGVPLTEIVRGNQHGPWSFFSETRQLDSYRPVQSLLMWTFGRADDPYRWISIRILHFICLGLSLGVTLLVMRELKLGLLASAVALGIAALHPTLAAATGSIDGFSSLLACSAVWLGAWMMFRLRHKFHLALGCAVGMLVIGTLIKEYAFALWPAAVLLVVCFFDRPVRRAVITFIVMAILTIIILQLRQFAKPDDLMALEPNEKDFAFRGLNQIVTNIALVIVGGLFTGDSLAVYVERTTPWLVLTAGTIIAVCAIIALGFIKAFRRGDPSNDETRLDRRWLIFLFLAPAVMSFPANTVMKIGEMYLCGVVTSVALLVGLCVQLITERCNSRTIITSIIFILLGVQAVLAIRHKSEGIVKGGEDAKLQTDQIREAIAAKPDAKKITLVFRRDLVPPRATFGAYRLAEIYHVRPPAAEYLFPGRGITFDCVMIDSADELGAIDLRDSDAALLWNAQLKQYESLK